MAHPLRHRSRVLSLLWALFRLLILLPLTLLGLVILSLGLALSPWGTGLLLDAGERQGFYTLESHEGAPLDRLVLRGLALEAGPAQVALERLELAWADDCLLKGRLCLDTLAVEGARIRVGASEASEEGDEAPVAPGTAGSLGAAAVYAAIRAGVAFPADVALFGACLLLASAGSVALGPWAVRRWNRPDPSPFVLDEVAGFFAAALIFPVGPWPVSVVALFLAFRLFDVTKPPPLPALERLPRGWGILADDLGAGVMAGALLHAGRLALQWL